MAKLHLDEIADTATILGTLLPVAERDSSASRKGISYLAQFPYSPGLQFKRVGKQRPVYSVRITDAYRVLGLLEGDTIYWFWIGAHDEYERIIRAA